MSGAPDESVDAIRRRIGPALEPDQRVRFAYLFGSVAQGTALGDFDRFARAVAEHLAALDNES